jgi:hypothetical protein
MISDDVIEKVDSAIGKAAEMSKTAQNDSLKSLQFSQAALNLTHSKVMLENMKANTNGNKK